MRALERKGSAALLVGAAAIGGGEGEGIGCVH
jgi:hypothetical protein